VLAAALFIVPRALAFGGWHGCRDSAQSADELRGRMQNRIEFVLDRLDATDAQRSQIQAIVAKSAPEMFAIAKEGHKLRSEVKESLASTAIDKARLERAHQDLDALANRATDIGTRTLLAVAEALTPEQRKQIAEHLARMHGEP
jgi:Spy/CpxP family protein refolding chaperone